MIRIPVVLVGGMNSAETINNALHDGFQFIAMARALIHNTRFINDLRNATISKSGCTVCNYCVARMYSGQIACYLNEKDLPPGLRNKIAAMEKEQQSDSLITISAT